MTDLITYLPWAAGIGVVAGFWQQIHVILKKIYDIFIIEVEIQGFGSTIIGAYLQSLGKSYFAGKRSIISRHLYVKPNFRWQNVLVEIISSEPSIIFINKRPLLITRVVGKDYDYDSAWGQTIKISSFRYLISLDKFLEDAYTFYHDKCLLNVRFKIVDLSGSNDMMTLKDKNYDDDFSSKGPKKISDINFDGKYVKYTKADISHSGLMSDVNTQNYIFSKKQTQLKDSVTRWVKSATWHHEHGILWKHGILLAGTPGTGKSSCIYHICKELDIPIYKFDLSSLTNKEMINHWKSCQADIPCAIVFEDIDAVYKGRENIKKGPSFDCLLNCISGIQINEGIFVFVTTNRLDYIDKALLRPGRLDEQITLDVMDEEDRKKLATAIMGIGYPKSLITKTKGFTPAECSELFTTTALDKFWEKK